jgi:hypothetical protein
LKRKPSLILNHLKMADKTLCILNHLKWAVGLSLSAFFNNHFPLIYEAHFFTFYAYTALPVADTVCSYGFVMAIQFLNDFMLFIVHHGRIQHTTVFYQQDSVYGLYPSSMQFCQKCFLLHRLREDGKLG